MVTLYWDDKAEESFDRYLRVYDFEGYKIYKATDPSFKDAGSITDGLGYVFTAIKTFAFGISSGKYISFLYVEYRNIQGCIQFK